MAGRDTSKQGYTGEPANAEIVFLKDNVTIHPTQYATERISGRLKLIKQDSLLFLVMLYCCDINVNLFCHILLGTFYVIIIKIRFFFLIVVDTL